MKNTYLASILGVCSTVSLLADVSDSQVQPVYSQSVTAHPQDKAMGPAWSNDYDMDKEVVKHDQNFRGEIMTLSAYQLESEKAESDLLKSSQSVRSGSSQNPIDGARQGYDSASADEKLTKVDRELEEKASNQAHSRELQEQYVLVVSEPGILGDTETVYMLEEHPRKLEINSGHESIAEVTQDQSGTLTFQNENGEVSNIKVSVKPDDFHDDEVYQVTGTLIEREGVDTIIVSNATRVYSKQG
ncbi:MAG: hypothetical protein ACQKBW_07935 [Puniceicoccales bacterium]